MDSPPPKPPFNPYAVLGIGVIAVSTASIFIRFAQSEVNSIVIGAYRLTIAAAILSIPTLLRYRKPIIDLNWRDRILGLGSGIFLAIHFAAWITSLEYTSVASSVILVTTTPLWVAVFSPITIKESTTKQIRAGLFIALIGAVIVALVDTCTTGQISSCPPIKEFFQTQSFYGDFLALLGAWAAAGYIIIGRSLRAKLPLIPYIFIVYGVAAVVLTGMALLSGHPISGFAPRTYLYLAFLALIPQLIGHSTFNWSLGFLPAAVVSVTLLGEPIGSIILAAVILQEVPSPIKLFGAILILGGILITSIKPTKSNSDNYLPTSE